MFSNVSPEFWYGKKVFVTGHTGFKGGWISLWLQSMGAKVKGYSLEAPTQPSLFNVANVENNIESEIGDIRDTDKLNASVSNFDPDIIIHMAAQPLVRLSYKEPKETYSTNVMGSLNVFEAARIAKNLRVIINITTDKCYENREWEWGYRENEAMGGADPYSSSKGCAELLASAYRRSFFNAADGPVLASVRAGNVIGGGDWAEDRLIPDILRAFENGSPVIIRNPNSIRPWQHVLEPLSGYLVLAQYAWENGQKFADGWNFGPRDTDAQPVGNILNKMVALWGENASWQLDGLEQPHEAKYLKLDISKAQMHLKWKPRWNIDIALDKIVKWHKSWLNGIDMHEYCLKEIKEFANTIN